MEVKEDANGSVKQMEDFAAEQPTADRAGLLAAAEGTTNGSARGEGPKPKSPDGVSGSSVESGSEVSPLHMDQEKSKTGTWHAEGLRVIIISCIVFSLSVTIALIITIYYGPPQVSPHGAVASSSETCSKVGTDILQDKGSAVDAAIAAVLCEGVVSSHLTGIGGGGFMIYRDHKNKKTITIDFREMAPASATKDMYSSKLNEKKYGPTSVAVPGLLKGLEAAHKKYGKKPWKDLVMPAVNLARNGFNATQALVDTIHSELMENGKINIDNQRLKDMYFIDEKPPKVGDKLNFTELADTLEEIANKGAEVFYSGHIAEDIATDVAEKNGYVTVEDLKGYTVTSPKPIESTFKNLTLQTLPPPAGGATVLTILNVMDLYGITKHNKTYNLTYHRLIEAMKFAQAYHDDLGDPVKYEGSMLNVTANMISMETAKKIKNEINDSMTFDAEYYGTLGTSEDHGTSHVSVIGPNEEMVSITTSINYYFGSLFVTRNGILLNNHMDDFSVPGGEGKEQPNLNNLIEPGKRPLSNMSPTLVFSKKQPCGKRVAVGGTHGRNITNGVAEVILNTVGFDESLKKAISAPRLVANRFDKVVAYEDEMDEDLVIFLGNLGHHMQKYDGIMNMVNAVGKINETVTAESDPRESSSKASVF